MMIQPCGYIRRILLLKSKLSTGRMASIIYMSHQEKKKMRLMEEELIKKMSCEPCKWKCERLGGDICYYCEVCGKYSKTAPHGLEKDVENNTNEAKDANESVESVNEEADTKCVHKWMSGNRCHNRGKGKYKTYKCEYCGKFYRSEK